MIDHHQQQTTHNNCEDILLCGCISVNDIISKIIVITFTFKMKRVCFLIYLFCFNIEFKLNCVWKTKKNTIRKFLLTIMLNRNHFTEQYQDN